MSVQSRAPVRTPSNNAQDRTRATLKSTSQILTCRSTQTLGLSLVMTKAIQASRFLVLVAAAVLFGPITGSTQNGCTVVDSSHPPQYFSFDHVEKLDSALKGEDRKRVWLRFYNNTTCSLLLISEMEPANRQMRIIKQPNGGIRFQRVIEPPEVPSSGTPIELAYRIQDNGMRRAPVNATSKHLVFSVRLLPERFVTFHVPLKYFREGMHITMPFNYEWELDKNGFMIGGFRVFHEAKFFNGELPKELLRKKT
jgi:hypothetical protein